MGKLDNDGLVLKLKHHDSTNNKVAQGCYGMFW